MNDTVEYHFPNTFEFEGDSPRKGLWNALCAVVIALCIIQTLFGNGMSILLLMAALVLFCIFWRLKTVRRTEEVVTSVMFDENGMNVVYRNIDRLNGRGPHTESFTIRPDLLDDIEQAESERLVKIVHRACGAQRTETWTLPDSGAGQELSRRLYQFYAEAMRHRY